jgi:hypothetical protein
MDVPWKVILALGVFVAGAILAACSRSAYRAALEWSAAAGSG